MIRLASILLALAALAAGLLAAYKWYKASTVEIDVGYTYPGSQPGETYRRMGMELPARSGTSGRPLDPLIAR